MTETTQEYVGDFAHLLKLRAAFSKDQNKLEAEKTEAGSSIKDEITRLRTRLETIHKPFAEHEDKLDEQIGVIVGQLREHWKDNPKTQYVDGCIIRRRHLKRIDIKDKVALVEELHKLGKLTDSIAKFDEKLLMKLAEVDVLKKDNIGIDVKHSISCQIDKNAVDDAPKAYVGMKSAEPGPKVALDTLDK